MLTEKYRHQLGPRFTIYLTGLLVMSLGVVLTIVAGLGPSSWDVLHVGLYYRFGLTIGSWSIIVGFIILTVAAFMMKAFPQFGAFLNMILVGVFMDLYLLLPFLDTPSSLAGQIVMFLSGLVIHGYGMGLYISAQLGTGPRDSLMLAITSKTGWKVGRVRSTLEIVVVIIGWQLGGPVFWGTIVLSVMIGVMAGFALPQCQRLTDTILKKLRKETHEQKVKKSL